MKQCEECNYEFIGENSAIVLFECTVCGHEKEEQQP